MNFLPTLPLRPAYLIPFPDPARTRAIQLMDERVRDREILNHRLSQEEADAAMAALPQRDKPLQEGTDWEYVSTPQPAIG